MDFDIFFDNRKNLSTQGKSGALFDGCNSDDHSLIFSFLCFRQFSDVTKDFLSSSIWDFNFVSKHSAMVDFFYFLLIIEKNLSTQGKSGVLFDGCNNVDHSLIPLDNQCTLDSKNVVLGTLNQLRP